MVTIDGKEMGKIALEFEKDRHKQFVKHMPVHLKKPIFEDEKIRQKITKLTKFNWHYA